MLRTLFVSAASLIAVLSTFPCSAQIRDKLTFHVGAGFTEPARYTDGRLKVGFNVTGGAGMNLTENVGLLAEFGYNNLGLSRRALDDAGGISNGSARIYSATINPKVRFGPTRRLELYAVGGGGFYRRTVEFTEPTVELVTAFDPFYGVFFPAAVPANLVLGSFSQNSAGLNIGGGLALALGAESNAKFFGETRYHYLYTTPIRTTILPVTFGVRW
jgi:opacity protein-like surface antigen